MAYVGFSRDEVILALDVLYTYGENGIGSNSPAVKELSELLNKLPIHPLSSRREGYAFRNPEGISVVIRTFARGRASGNYDNKVGLKHIQVASEYAGREEELHAIATAIRRNADAYSDFAFGDDAEAESFPEGALLGHLHRAMEARDGARYPVGTRCEICQIETTSIYRNNINLMEQHLTVPITELDAHKRYGANHFVTVCPNCHAALHRLRPWISTYDLDKTLL